MRGDVLLDGLRGLIGDLFYIMGGAVVPVLAMQTRHGCEMLLNQVRQARVPQVLVHPVVIGDVFRLRASVSTPPSLVGSGSHRT